MNVNLCKFAAMLSNKQAYVPILSCSILLCRSFLASSEFWILTGSHCGLENREVRKAANASTKVDLDYNGRRGNWQEGTCKGKG
jgi:hypothetical protein